MHCGKPKYEIENKDLNLIWAMEDPYSGKIGIR
jgi:hypothetical protein